MTESPRMPGYPPRMSGAGKTTMSEEFQSSVVTRTRAKTKRPPMYKVMIVNDDYTPMDFVVQVLKACFYKSHEEAISIMLQVHHNGSGICGVYTRDVAETKVEQVLSNSRQGEHPLRCVMEKE